MEQRKIQIHATLDATFEVKEIAGPVLATCTASRVYVEGEGNDEAQKNLEDAVHKYLQKIGSRGIVLEPTH